MSVMVQVRGVPETVHRTLKARAALAGMSLSEYLLAELRLIASRPTLEELFERIDRRDAVDLAEPTVDAVRAEREGR